MTTSRSYRDGCGIARALDVVGARWALLVVRELLFGPLRFTDLRRALPLASTNMLTDRLRELEDSGVVAQRRLAPPAAATVYELTEWGRELEPILGMLGSWGLRAPRPDPAHLSPTSMMLFLQGAARPPGEIDSSTFSIELDDRPFAVRCTAGRLDVQAGVPDAPDASLQCDPATLYDLVCGRVDMQSAIEDGRLRMLGEPSMVSALIEAVPGE